MFLKCLKSFHSARVIVTISGINFELWAIFSEDISQIGNFGFGAFVDRLEVLKNFFLESVKFRQIAENNGDVIFAEKLSSVLTGNNIAIEHVLKIIFNGVVAKNGGFTKLIVVLESDEFLLQISIGE